MHGRVEFFPLSVHSSSGLLVITFWACLGCIWRHGCSSGSHRQTRLYMKTRMFFRISSPNSAVSEDTDVLPDFIAKLGCIWRHGCSSGSHRQTWLYLKTWIFFRISSPNSAVSEDLDILPDLIAKLGCIWRHECSSGSHRQTWLYLKTWIFFRISSPNSAVSEDLDILPDCIRRTRHLYLSSTTNIGRKVLSCPIDGSLFRPRNSVIADSLQRLPEVTGDLRPYTSTGWEGCRRCRACRRLECSRPPAAASTGERPPRPWTRQLKRHTTRLYIQHSRPDCVSSLYFCLYLY